MYKTTRQSTLKSLLMPSRSARQRRMRIWVLSQNPPATWPRHTGNSRPRRMHMPWRWRLRSRWACSACAATSGVTRTRSAWNPSYVCCRGRRPSSCCTIGASAARQHVAMRVPMLATGVWHAHLYPIHLPLCNNGDEAWIDALRRRYNFACAAAQCGRQQEAAEVLQRLLALGHTSPADLAGDQDFAAVRGQQWFTQLLEGST